MKIRNLPWPIFTLLVASATAVRMEAGTFAEVNWALTGTASQSSDLDGVHVASLAIDGNTDGAWTHGSVTHTGNTDDPPWWEVELGGMKPIGRVQVWFRTDCCQSRNDDFTLSVLDGQRNEVWRRTYPGRPPTTVSYDFAPAIQGEIIRVEGQTPRTTSDGYLALAEVQVIAPYPNIAITVTQNPTNATTFEGHSATFGPVAAVASDTNIPPDKFAIQWQKNEVAIAGANGATYTTPLELVSDNGAQFAATFTLPGAMAVSAKATLTVIQDLVPPLVSSVGFAGGTTLQFSVNFSKLMDATTVTNLTNYVFGPGISILKATLGGPTPNENNNTFFNSAILSVVGLPPNTNYTLTVSGVKDLAGNTVAATNLSGTVPFYEVNHAPAGTATQSSDLDTVHVASLAIDGNTDGNWNDGSVTHTLNQDDPPWWEVDLGAPKIIGAVSVWFRTDWQNRDDDFTEIVFAEQRNEVFRRTFPGRPPRNVTYNFAPPIQARTIRIEGQTPRTTSDGYLSLAEVQAIAPYQNVSLNIAQGPTNITVVQNTSAVFGPVAPEVVGAPSEKITYQWQKDGMDIPGATTASYTTPPLSLAENGAKYAIRVFLPGLSVLSSSATVTVIQDREPPRVVFVDSVSSGGDATFFVSFSEFMDPTTTINVANYAFGPGTAVSAATLDTGGTRVAVNVGGLGSNSQFSLTVSGVQDLAGNPIVSTNLRGTIQIDYAMTGTASQSSDLDTEHIASLAIDGNTDGDWSHGSVTHTANTDDPPVWEVDLGQTNLIGEVRVWFRTDCCQSRNDDFTLYVLDANHAKVLSRKYPGRPPGNVAYNFAPAVVGRYVRIEGQTPRTTSDGYLALAEVQVFNPFQIESIRITQGPTNVAAIANATATFGPVIADAPGVAPGKLTFQWRKNGEDIPGAIGASYTTPPLSPADNGAQYTIQAMLPGVSASATATLTVTAAPPVLTIQHTGNTIQISWPVSATGFVLQSTESLSSPAWAQPAESVSIQGDQNTVTITDPDNTRFYRLKL